MIHYSQDILGVVARFCRPVTFRYAWHKKKLMKLASQESTYQAVLPFDIDFFFFFLEKHNVLVVVVFCFVFFFLYIYCLKRTIDFPIKCQRKST